MLLGRLGTGSTVRIVLDMFPKAFRVIQRQVRLFSVNNADQRVWSAFILNTLRWSCPPKVAGIRPLCSLHEADSVTFHGLPGLELFS